MSAPLRHAFIMLSKNPWMQDVIVGFPVSRRVARRFVAGERLSEAIAAARRVNARGIMATLDYLGENVISRTQAQANVDEYIRVLQAIAAEQVEANISIKLTAMGLAIDEEFCYQNVRRLADQAAALDNFVRIDMEDSSVTEQTLNIYRRLRQDFANVGVVIQSYLYRSEDDVRSLMREGIANLRLCKGAYDEPPTVAYQAKQDVDHNYRVLARLMFDGLDDHPGTYPALATHDHMIINWAKAYTYHHHIAADRFEFQMLYGVRSELQDRLAQQGYRMRVYIPYGTHWYPYFMRRLAERPANVVFFLRALRGG